MKLKSLLAVSAMSAVLPLMTSGCAETGETKAQAAEEPVYRTGSNIAVRQRVNRENGVQTMTAEEFERARIPQMPRPAATGSR